MRNLLLTVKNRRSRFLAVLGMTGWGDFHLHWWAEGPQNTRRNDRIGIGCSPSPGFEFAISSFQHPGAHAGWTSATGASRST